MKILIIAPHPDDEIIGVGGTIARYVNEGNEVFVCVVTRGEMPLFTPESVQRVREECEKADTLLGVKETIFLDFPAAMLEEVPRYKLNNGLLGVIKSINPDEVYIPHRGDMQLDHKMIVDAAMVALRPRDINTVKRIYSYETLSETGWDIPNSTNEFVPTVYSDISMYLERKIDALCMYKTQIVEFPNARSIEAVKALATYRGITVNVVAAEAFSLIREIR